MALPITFKKCNNCNTIKSYTEYYINNKMVGGRAAQCKKCHKDYAKLSNIKYSDSKIDYNRICKVLNQPREGLSNSSLVELWNIFTDLYLPRDTDINKPLKSIITGEAINE